MRQRRYYQLTELHQELGPGRDRDGRLMHALFMNRDNRVAREKKFHDEGSHLRARIDRINRPVARELEATLLSNLSDIAGLDVLQLGCGAGEIGITDQLHQYGPRTLISFDVAKSRVLEAKRRRSGLDEYFMVADGHRLPVKTASIDLVVGLAILHHLDLPIALAEIRRVLRPSGRLVVAEPLAYHPLVAIGRLLTPSARTPDEQPFRRRELDLISQSFYSCTMTYVHLLAPILAWPLALVSQNAAAWIVSKVRTIDRALVTQYPGLGSSCWYVVIDASIGDPAMDGLLDHRNQDRSVARSPGRRTDS